MAGVLSTILGLVFLAVVSLIGGLFIRREGSEAWKKFLYSSIVCLVVAGILFAFFLSSLS